MPPAHGRDCRRRLLPKQFAGWQIQGADQASKEAAAADPTNAALLKEYGFTDLKSATYKSDDGRTLKIRAARFADASGAFGAYSFYVQPEMARQEDIGDQGGIDSIERVLVLPRAHRGRGCVQPVVGDVGGGPAGTGGRVAAARRKCGQPASDSGFHAAPWLSRRIQRNMRRDRWGWVRSRLRCRRSWSISAPTLKWCSGNTHSGRRSNADAD